MKMGLLVLLALLIAGSGTQLTSNSSTQAQATADTYVVEWNEVAMRAFTASGLSPAEAFPALAQVGIAVYDSVVAVRGTYEPFAVHAQALPGTSAEAAVVSAAYRALSRVFPWQDASILAPAYLASMATIPEGSSKEKGIALGRDVADELFRERSRYGFQPSLTDPTPSTPGIGVWVPTAPVPPIGPTLGRVQPFGMESVRDLIPNGPPALSGAEWAAEFNEVKAIGARNSTTRTPEQTLAARFWAEAPIQQAELSYRKFMRDRELDVVEAARLMAMLSVTRANAAIACWQAKYLYDFWRPVTAIPAGDSDGNAETVGDPSWLPLLPVTPNHPEYPSAHSCVTPATARVIASFLGSENISLTMPSLTGLGDRYYPTMQSLITEVGEARIWGGIHFRSAIEDGTRIGMRTADYVLCRYFRPLTAPSC